MQEQEQAKEYVQINEHKVGKEETFKINKKLLESFPKNSQKEIKSIVDNSNKLYDNAFKMPGEIQLLGGIKLDKTQEKGLKNIAREAADRTNKAIDEYNLGAQKNISTLRINLSKIGDFAFTAGVDKKETLSKLSNK